MAKNHYAIFLFIFLFSLSFISAKSSTSYADCSVYGNCKTPSTGNVTANIIANYNNITQNFTNNISVFYNITNNITTINNITNDYTTTNNITNNITTLAEVNSTQFDSNDPISINQTWLESFIEAISKWTDYFTKAETNSTIDAKITEFNSTLNLTSGSSGIANETDPIAMRDNPYQAIGISKNYKAGDNINIVSNVPLHNVTLDLASGDNLIAISSNSYIGIDEVIFDGNYTYAQAKSAGIINQINVPQNALDTAGTIEVKVFQPNHAYWIRTNQATNISFRDVVGDINGDKITLSNIRFMNSSGTILNISSARSAGWLAGSSVNSIIYYWDYDVGDWGNVLSSQSLNSWQGYMLYSYKSNIYLLTPTSSGNGTGILLTKGWNNFGIILNETQESYNISSTASGSSDLTNVAYTNETNTFNQTQYLNGNITNSVNSSWGIYNDGNCIVIGNLVYASEC
jgi:hypothetical protein